MRPEFTPPKAPPARLPPAGRVAGRAPPPPGRAPAPPPGTSACASSRTSACSCSYSSSGTSPRACACAWPVSDPAARAQHLIAAAPAEIHAVLRAAAPGVPAKSVRDIGVVVAHALAMRGIMLPLSGAIDVTDVDISVAPVDASAPAAGPAAAPVAEAVAETEADARADHAGPDIAGPIIRPIGRRIRRIIPGAVDNAGIVIRHIDRVRLRGLDCDDLPSILLLRHDRLLRGRDELVVRLRLQTKPLDCIHDVGLLGENRVAKLLGPVELIAHQFEHVRRRRQRFDAVVPALLDDGGLKRVALEGLVGGDPSLRLHHLKRVGRSHQHLREQIVGVERDRGHQSLELPLRQKLLGGRGLRRGRLRRRGGGLLRRSELRRNH